MSGEHSPYSIEFQKGAVIVSDLKRADLLSLIGPNGLSIVSQKEGEPTRYAVEGVTGVNVSRWVDEGSIVINTDIHNQVYQRYLEGWLKKHFKDLYSARAVTEEALRKVRHTRSA